MMMMMMMMMKYVEMKIHTELLVVCYILMLI